MSASLIFAIAGVALLYIPAVAFFLGTLRYAD